MHLKTVKTLLTEATTNQGFSQGIKPTTIDQKKIQKALLSTDTTQEEMTKATADGCVEAALQVKTACSVDRVTTAKCCADNVTRETPPATTAVAAASTADNVPQFALQKNGEEAEELLELEAHRLAVMFNKQQVTLHEGAGVTEEQQGLLGPWMAITTRGLDSSVTKIPRVESQSSLSNHKEMPALGRLINSYNDILSPKPPLRSSLDGEFSWVRGECAMGDAAKDHIIHSPSVDTVNKIPESVGAASALWRDGRSMHNFWSSSSSSQEQQQSSAVLKGGLDIGITSCTNTDFVKGLPQHREDAKGGGKRLDMDLAQEDVCFANSEVDLNPSRSLETGSLTPQRESSRYQRLCLFGGDAEIYGRAAGDTVSGPAESPVKEKDGGGGNVPTLKDTIKLGLCDRTMQRLANVTTVTDPSDDEKHQQQKQEQQGGRQQQQRRPETASGEALPLVHGSSCHGVFPANGMEEEEGDYVSTGWTGGILAEVTRVVILGERLSPALKDIYIEKVRGMLVLCVPCRLCVEPLPETICDDGQAAHGFRRWSVAQLHRRGNRGELFIPILLRS